MKYNKKKFYVRSVAVILVVAVIGLIITNIKYLGFSDYKPLTSASVVLLYEDASKGVAPDGTRFNKESLVTEEAIKKTLEDLGWSDKYSVEKIRNSINIKGSYPDNIVSEFTEYNSIFQYDTSANVTDKVKLTEYNPTAFTVTLKTDFDGKIGANDLNKLLDGIISNSTEMFLADHSFTYAYEFKDGILDVDDYDYSAKLDVIRSRIQGLRLYANELYNKKTAFVFNGTSFNDIVLRCDTLSNYDIYYIDSLVKLMALSTNPERLLKQYEHSVEILSYRYDELNKKYNEIAKVIADYPNTEDIYFISGNVSEKISGNSEETYNRLIETKTGYNDSMSDITSQITRLNSYIEILKTPSTDETVFADVDARLEALGRSLDDIEESFGILLEEFNRKYITTETAIETTDAVFANHSVFSIGFIVEFIKVAGPLCLIALMALIGYSIALEVAASKRKANTKA